MGVAELVDQSGSGLFRPRLQSNIDPKIPMKINSKSARASLIAVMALVVGGLTAQLHAEDHKFGDHDKTGYWDANQQHHAYVMHNNHRGYWDQRNGAHIWVNVD